LAQMYSLRLFDRNMVTTRISSSMFHCGCREELNKERVALLWNG